MFVKLISLLKTNPLVMVGSSALSVTSALAFLDYNRENGKIIQLDLIKDEENHTRQALRDLHSIALGGKLRYFDILSERNRCRVC